MYKGAARCSCCRIGSAPVPLGLLLTYSSGRLWSQSRFLLLKAFPGGLARACLWQQTFFWSDVLVSIPQRLGLLISCPWLSSPLELVHTPWDLRSEHSIDGTTATVNSHCLKCWSFVNSFLRLLWIPGPLRPGLRLAVDCRCASSSAGVPVVCLSLPSLHLCYSFCALLDSWVVVLPKLDGTFWLIFTFTKTPPQHSFYKGLNRNVSHTYFLEASVWIPLMFHTLPRSSSVLHKSEGYLKKMRVMENVLLMNIVEQASKLYLVSFLLWFYSP